MVSPTGSGKMLGKKHNSSLLIYTAPIMFQDHMVKSWLSFSQKIPKKWAEKAFNLAKHGFKQDWDAFMSQSYCVGVELRLSLSWDWGLVKA